jgi:hypothetical protein
MRAITIKSIEVLTEAQQIEVHYAFRMEHHTDYVFKPGEEEVYSATIAIGDSKQVIESVKKGSLNFPDYEFLLEDLDVESNVATTYRFGNGKLLDKKFNIS